MRVRQKIRVRAAASLSATTYFAVKLGEFYMPGSFNNHHHVIGIAPDRPEQRDWCGTIPRVIEIGGSSEDYDARGTCNASFEFSASCASVDYECANDLGDRNLSVDSLLAPKH